MDALALRAVAEGGVVDGDRSHGTAHSTPSARRWQPASAGAGETNAFHFLHSAAWKNRLAVMGVLMVLTAHVVFCNHALMWSNSRKKTSRSLIPILGLAFAAPACLAAPPGSVWRWVAAAITLADPGTWLTFWIIRNLLRHLASSGAWALRRRPR